VAAGAVAATLVVPDVPARVVDSYELFVERGEPLAKTDRRGRILDPAHNGRLDIWRVALEGYRAAPWSGQGAGTYQLLWDRWRPYETLVFDGHSVYLESLAELGLPGLGLVGIALAVLLGGAARRVRGPDRALFAAVLAAMLTWAIRAGVDWDWEMPVVTLWVFALGGATLAVAVPATNRPPRLSRRRPVAVPGRTLRLTIAVGCLVIAVAPARVAVSQAHLNRSVDALARNDCATAIDASLDSIAAIGLRPEPYELLAWCDVRFGAPDLAVRAMLQAVQRDPRNWRYRYGLALVRGAAGRDPLPEALHAARLNPREPVAREAVESFRTRDPREWRRRALGSPLPPD
jgi:hypothetical protein